VRPVLQALPTRPDELAREVRALALVGGLDAVGIASAAPLLRARAALEARKTDGLDGGMAFTYRNPVRSTSPAGLVEGAAAIVVGARRYESALPPRPDGRGPVAQVARYAWADHYGQLEAALSDVARYLKAHGYRARVLVDDNGLVDREVAYRAGLGWFGKNANLLRPGEGSWYVLGSVVTNAPLPVNDAPVADHCGSCRRCMDGCPTGAIVAPGVVDARRCLAWLVQAPGTFPRAYREALGGRIYGCDDCQEVCPPNLRADAARARAAGPVGSAPARTAGTTAPAPTAHVDGAWVSLLDLLAADDDALLARHGRWYIAQRDPRWLRRNALIAIGNVADPDDPEVADALLRYLRHADPMLRAHAIWACRRLGRDDLLAALADLARQHADQGAGHDGDQAPAPEVAEELAAPPPILRARP
jgi:epoxyqueuosine reductase